MLKIIHAECIHVKVLAWWMIAGKRTTFFGSSSSIKDNYRAQAFIKRKKITTFVQKLKVEDTKHE